MNEAILKAALTKPHGYVVIEHRAYPLSIPATQLIIDTPRFLEGMATVFDPRSHSNLGDDNKRACESWSEIIKELRDSKSYPEGREQVPWVYDRALLPVWTVGSYAEALQYAKSLVELNSVWDEAGDPEFAVILSDFNRPLLAAESCFESTIKFAGDYFEARLLPSAEIERLVLNEVAK
ncbi:MAG TPA: hypothetical protein VGL56_06415 [Fimbriimonadaceae bacterium]|jgi:hypothetical protein